MVVSTEPWIVTFDNFMNESETDALIAAVGADSGGPGFVRSTDTGNTKGLNAISSCNTCYSFLVLNTRSYR